MIRNGIYSTMTKKEKPVARVLAIVFGILAGLLLIFIVWSALAFGGQEDAYVPQAEEISALKIQVETQTQTIDSLRSEIVDLKAELEAEKKKNAELMKPEEPPADAVEQPISGENVDSEE